MIKISEIIIKKSTFNRLLIGIIVASIVSAFLGGYVLGSKDINSVFGNDENNSKIASPSQIETRIEQKDSSVIAVSLDDDPVMENPDAPISLIDFCWILVQLAVVLLVFHLVKRVLLKLE